MTISGGMGALGGLPQSTPEELNKSAWTEVNKASLQIVSADTYEVIPFTETGGTNIWKYLSENNPLLDMPLLMMRAKVSEAAQKEDSGGSPIYQELLHALPPNVALWMQEQSALPLNMRQDDYASVNTLLQGAALLLTILYSEAIETPVLHEVHYHVEGLPLTLLKGNIHQGGEILNRAEKALETLDPGSAHHDNLTECSANLKLILSDLNLLAKGLTSP